MWNYLTFSLLCYCISCWVIGILHIYINYENHRRKFGYLWFPTIAVTIVLLPILLLVQIVGGIVKWLLGWNFK